MNTMNTVNATDAMNAATAGTIEGTEQVRWDLSILYSDIEDPRLDSDLKALAAMAKHFSAATKASSRSACQGPSKTIRKSRCSAAKSPRIFSCARAPILPTTAIKAKHAAFQRELSAIQGEHLTFFELELVHVQRRHASNRCMKAIRSSPSIAPGSSMSAYSSPTF